MTNRIAPFLPLKIDDDGGDYLSINRIKPLVRQNLKNLILTNPGERIMDPNFGVGIKRFLFENRTNTLTNTIRSLITGQVKKYMPFVSITNVEFSDGIENPNFLGINIFYIIVPNNTSDNLFLEVARLEREAIARGRLAAFNT